MSFKNSNHFNQNKYEFPIHNLTKIQSSETPKRIEGRLSKLHKCSWLTTRQDFLGVIDHPWIPQYKTKENLATAKPLNDFEVHLETGINELKTLNSNNLLIFYMQS